VSESLSFELFSQLSGFNSQFLTQTEFENPKKIHFKPGKAFSGSLQQGLHGSLQQGLHV
jgi:hypothetical protein